MYRSTAGLLMLTFGKLAIAFIFLFLTTASIYLFPFNTSAIANKFPLTVFLCISPLQDTTLPRVPESGR